MVPGSLAGRWVSLVPGSFRNPLRVPPVPCFWGPGTVANNLAAGGDAIRFQRLDARQVREEAAVNPSQPAAARVGREAGRMEMVELPPLSIRHAGNGGD